MTQNHNHQKLLDAAARVYAEHGFRGATTRRIAEEAGVNEVTLFRIFGSKSALIDKALRSHAPTMDDASLPERPVDPERELAEWCAAQMARLRGKRALIRKTLGELEERPEVASCMSSGPTAAFRELRAYASRLPGTRRTDARELSAAAAMLAGALFADAMGRDMMPLMYPQPEGAAPALYATLFLRAIGAADGRRNGRPRIRRSHRQPRGATNGHE